MGERRLPPPRFCYQLVLDWTVEPWGRRPCKQPVYRELRHGTIDGKPVVEWVCFDHSPNARRPKPEGR